MHLFMTVSWVPWQPWLIVSIMLIASRRSHSDLAHRLVRMEKDMDELEIGGNKIGGNITVLPPLPYYRHYLTAYGGNYRGNDILG